MTTHNAENERTKRQYFAYLKEAMRHSESTVDAVAMALARFEVFTKHRGFRAFHSSHAVAFKKSLSGQQSQKTGAKLSKATLNTTLAHLTKFFHWLAGQPGFKSRLQYGDAEYFNLSDNDMRVATAKREQTGPTFDQVRHVIALMPAEDVIQRRDRALIAFTLLTGARDGAIASMKLKHIDTEAGHIEQDAREVKTKFGKIFTTYFFPVGDWIRKIVTNWVTFLREDMHWGENDPLFPATHVGLGVTRQFEAVGVERVHWSSASPIRTIFRRAFDAAGVPYFNPHSLRNTLVRLGQATCRTPEDFKAWSQNLGHDKVLTTFTSYGQIESHRQAEIIHGLGAPPLAAQSDVRELAKMLAREMMEHLPKTSVQEVDGRSYKP